MNIKKSIFYFLLLVGCNSQKTQEIKKETDKFVGDWVDITGEIKDTVSITKIHDFGYKIGQNTAQLRTLENGQEFLYSISQNQIEVQFIYDKMTSHLIMRNPLFTVEYRKVE